MINKRVSIVMCLIVLASLVWAFYALSSWASRGGEQTPIYSVRRHDPYGTAALFELLKKRHVDVRTLERSKLRDTDHGVLLQLVAVTADQDVALHPPAPRLQPQRLKEWMLKGNTVIQLTPVRTKLMDACNVPVLAGQTADKTDKTDKADKADKTDKTWKRMQDQMIKGVSPKELEWTRVAATWISEEYDVPGPIVLHAPGMLSPQATASWRPLAIWRDHGAVIGAQRVGQGRLIIITTPTPVLNQTLGQGANLEMILALIGDNPVLFDEWSHGIGHGDTMIGIIADMGLLPVMAQIVFALILFTWSTRGHRRQTMPQVQRKRSTAEQVVTLGYLYHRSLSPVEINRRVHEVVQRRIAKALRCSVAQLAHKLKNKDDDVTKKICKVLSSPSRAIPGPAIPCTSCGYNLRGNHSGVCPECARPIPPAQQREIVSDDTHLSRTGPSQDDVGRSTVETDALRLMADSYHLSRELLHE